MNVLALAKSAIRSMGRDPRSLYHALSAASLRAAAWDQGLTPLIEHLRAVVPDISTQYTHGLDDTEYVRYWEAKIRGLHAFQVRCALDVIDSIGRDGLVVADIGDSSGNHLAYIQAVAPEGKVARAISVNLDPVAVDKIRNKGGEAVLCRAEEMDLEGIRPDLFLSFEMVEHLTDPVRFLHGLAARGSAEHVLITVPYRRDSRFGGWHLRLPEDAMPERMTAEDVHVFEFSPADWRLLARFAGFRTEFSRIYRQYPRHSLLRLTEPMWRRLDFEGFLALHLRRDLALANRYVDW